MKNNSNNLVFISAIVSIVLIGGAFIYAKTDKNNNQNNLSVNKNSGVERVEIYNQTEDYKGTKGEKVVFQNGKVEIDVSGFDDNVARFYNIEVPSGKIVYFFVVKDKNGIYRAAANECQVCYQVKKGFRQEGEEMVCNNCGNRYPIEKIATEKGGCNPAPIDPNLEILSGKATIDVQKLEEVSKFF